MKRMECVWLVGLLLVVVACGKKKDDPTPGTGQGAVVVWPPLVEVPFGLPQAFTVWDQRESPPLDVTGDVSWSTEDASVADVDVSGILTPNGPGSTLITASVPGWPEDIHVPVDILDLPPTLLEISPTPIRMPEGGPHQVTVAGCWDDWGCADVTSIATWSLSPATGRATIDANGLVTAELGNPGSLDVIATFGTQTDVSNGFVVAGSCVSLDILEPAVSLPEGVEVPLYARATLSDGSSGLPTGLEATFSTSGVAEFDPAPITATISGVQAGGTDVVLDYAGQCSGFSTITVTDACLISIEIEAGAPYEAELDEWPDPNGAFPLGIDVPLIAVGTFSDGVQLPITEEVNWASSVSSLVPGDSGEFMAVEELGPWEIDTGPAIAGANVVVCDPNAMPVASASGGSAGPSGGFAFQHVAVAGDFANGTGPCGFPATFTTALDVSGAGGRLWFHQAATNDLNFGWIAPDGRFVIRRLDGLEAYVGQLNTDGSGTARNFYFDPTCGWNTWDVTLTPN